MNTEVEKEHDPSVPDDTVDLLDYVVIVARRKWVVAGSTFSGAVIAVVLSLVLPKIYVSTALVLPPQQDQSISAAVMGQMSGGLGALAGGLLSGGSTSDLYVGIMQSQAVKDVIIDKFRLIDLYKQKYRLDTYEELDKRVKITAGKKDGIVSVVVEDEQPKRAADIANAFVDELARLTVKLDASGAGESRTFLEQRLAQARTELTRAEDALKSFQTRHKVLDVPEQAKVSVAGIADLKAQLIAQEVILAGQRRALTDASPDVKNTLAIVANLKEQIARLEGKGGGVIPSIGSVPQLGQDYLRLMREFAIQQSLVEILTKQYEMQRLSEAKNYSSIKVLQRATQADKKTKPKRRLIVMGGTIAGLLSGITLAFLMETARRMRMTEQPKWRTVAEAFRGTPRSQAEQ